jgi:acetoacetate decarboxylase
LNGVWPREWPPELVRETAKHAESEAARIGEWQMRLEDVPRQFTTPLGAPAFPKGIYQFKNREYLNIVYRTDSAPLREIVPEPLEIDEPLVRFEVISMPDVIGLGSYAESGQVSPYGWARNGASMCTPCT